MTTTDRQEEGPRLGADADAARKRAAVETYVRNEASLRRTAGRYSICADDAEDALQRGLEIVLRKAPTDDPRELIRWTQTVVKHEALAVRRERERILAGPAAAPPQEGAEDWVALLPSAAAGPAEQAERQEAVARSREALQALKPQELRALTLLAEGYSYAEIGEMTGYSRTKVNRCLAEGRERFRKIVSRSEDGQRCAELRPAISAFCDGEASAAEVATLREHLRACGRCRATLRAYRAAPGAAAALAPLPALDRSLLERVHDALGGLAARFTPRGGDAVGLSQVGGGTRGLGVAGLAKIAALCAGTAAGSAACVATGLVPAPLGIGSHDGPSRSAQVRTVRLDAQTNDVAVPYETATAPPSQPVEAATPHHSEPSGAKSAAPPPEPADGSPETAAVESGAVEYVPPAPEPAPDAATAPVAASSGSPAGEFGP
ncbi:MAG TPA: sigma-70 family RNA polymerase sigma factor [Solirubrobacterales bacterium]|nr:sigma-70 family RNA polymerase sigma factor [Solirubrobacterales bacterium]